MRPHLEEGNVHIFGVVGYPLSHSLSPTLHNWAFKKFSLPYVYLRWEIPPSYLPEFMVAVRTLQIKGVSVTIPFKETIVPYLDKLTEDALKVGAVNHLFWQESCLWGNNTDVEGFLKPLEEIQIDSSLVLGSGGAALAVIWGLIKKGVRKIYVAGRNPNKLSFLKKKFNILPIPWEKRFSIEANLLVNATPLGMRSYSPSIPFPEDLLENFSVVYDIVYNPIETPLLKSARKKGCVVIDGLTMFIHQGLLQFEKWTQHRFSVSSAHSLLSQILSS